MSAVPELYRQRVRAGFGLWLDYSQKPNYFTPEEFQRALGYALEISDEYVWLYTHGPRFFPPTNIQPSYIEAIAGHTAGHHSDRCTDAAYPDHHRHFPS